MNKKISGIYKITNKINGKSYIGQSKDIYKRWKQHKEEAENLQTKNELYLDMQKYGLKNFEFKILEKTPLLYTLDYKEIYYIEKYDTFNNGYNKTHGGHSGININTKGLRLPN